jgi:hypothetical protein
MNGRIEHYIGRATGREAAHHQQAVTLNKQWEQAQHPHPAVVECVCGRARTIELLFRCYHCGLWYCEVCAPEHFGSEQREHDYNE